MQLVGSPYPVNTGGKAPYTSERNSIIDIKRANDSSNVTYYDDRGRAFSREDNKVLMAREHRFNYNEPDFQLSKIFLGNYQKTEHP
ncbi:hypothetical protein GTG28_07600 [Vibrio sp. OCN044]|uniref:Uncharacterized protein n=1 Tax=Vibrio tetraodonis subsp. pristinus TaxID=2695891 RepID=A0A6L8LTN9_9VIBR|nr:hypothetical protein [Vibrio tetraodonis]MYM59085.1 hypothetical protein [Vibrio tetraodonis subsp. pristinus]